MKKKWCPDCELSWDIEELDPSFCPSCYLAATSGKELPLKALLFRLGEAAQDSLMVGYVTTGLMEYMRELQRHSSMTKNPTTD